MYGNNYGEATYSFYAARRHQLLLTMFCFISSAKMWNKNYKCKKKYYNLVSSGAVYWADAVTQLASM